MFRQHSEELQGRKYRGAGLIIEACVGSSMKRHLSP